MSDWTDWHVALRTGPGFKAILVSLTRIVEKLAAMAEDDLERMPVGPAAPSTDRRHARAISGFCIRTPVTGEGVIVERFGNVRTEPEGGDPVVTAAREPLTELHNHDSYLELRLEVPGIRAQDLYIEADGHVVRLFAEHGEYKYHKEMRLPLIARRERLEVDCSDGLARIRCPK